MRKLPPLFFTRSFLRWLAAQDLFQHCRTADDEIVEWRRLCHRCLSQEPAAGTEQGLGSVRTERNANGLRDEGHAAGIEDSRRKSNCAWAKLGEGISPSPPDAVSCRSTPARIRSRARGNVAGHIQHSEVDLNTLDHACPVNFRNPVPSAPSLQKRVSKQSTHIIRTRIPSEKL
jgi:hypothetical protein